MDKPIYPHRPIASIDALARTLGVHPSLLLDIAGKTSTSYTEFLVESKTKERTVYEPKYELKRLQKRINKRIFEKVEFPAYLQGGIKDEKEKRDYIQNATRHQKARTLISIDIKNFYDNIRPKHVENLFLNFFRFSPEVSKTLTNLVILGNKVPQGACTSSYVANLIFFNSEYKVVSDLRGKKITYSRLLDDVTLSSQGTLTKDEKSLYIKQVASLFSKYQLKLNNKKTKIKEKRSNSSDFNVTGLWVGHGRPQLNKDERHRIRSLVHLCEKRYKDNPYSTDYHHLWNKASGQVAKMKQLHGPQTRLLRDRLSRILPLYDDSTKQKIVLQVKKLCNSKRSAKLRPGVLRRINICLHKLGILSRTDKNLAKDLRKKIENHFGNIPSKKSIWE